MGVIILLLVALIWIIYNSPERVEYRRERAHFNQVNERRIENGERPLTQQEQNAIRAYCASGEERAIRNCIDNRWE